MHNITFTNLEDKLVLLTFQVDKLVTLKFTGVETDYVCPTWYSVSENISLPYNKTIAAAYKAWQHNKKYAVQINKLKRAS